MRFRAAIASVAILLSACGLTGAPDDQDIEATPAPAAEFTPPADCVNSRDVGSLMELADPAGCYGSQELTLESHATLLMGAIDCPGQLEPDWLGCGGVMIQLFPLPDTGTLPEIRLVATTPAGEWEWLGAVLHPSYDIDLSRGLDMLVTATGHFDDPAAQTCHYANWPDANPPPAEFVINGCRNTFVITHLEPLDAGDPSDTNSG